MHPSYSLHWNKNLVIFNNTSPINSIFHTFMFFFYSSTCCKDIQRSSLHVTFSSSDIDKHNPPLQLQKSVTARLNMVLKLYGSSKSPLARLVAAILLEKEVPFEFIIVDYGKDLKSPKYLQLHPFGQVPCIVHTAPLLFHFYFVSSTYVYSV